MVPRPISSEDSVSRSEQLYPQLSSQLEAFPGRLHRRRLANWVWIIVEMVLARSVHRSVQLSAIANHLPEHTDAAARVTKIRRWLKNPHIHTRTLYEPVITQALHTWRGRQLTSMLDGCFVDADRLQMLPVSLSHCYRALPLAWEVVTSKGLVALDSCEEMLDHVAQLLARTRRVTFPADRGFRDRDWASKCQEVKSDSIIRIANNTTIRFGDGHTTSAERLGIKQGQRRYLPGVRITHEADWQCNLAITWTRATAKSPAELCVLMTNPHADGWVLRHYLKRMHSEERGSISMQRA
jgi:hypothetical protein